MNRIAFFLLVLTVIVDDGVNWSAGNKKEFSSKDSPFPQVQYFNMPMILWLTIDMNIELL